MRHQPFLSLCLLGLIALGCKSPMMRVRVPDTASGPPVVNHLTDLGGLPLPELGEIPLVHSDKTLTPGEWIAVRGKIWMPVPNYRLMGKGFPSRAT